MKKKLSKTNKLYAFTLRLHDMMEQEGISGFLVLNFRDDVNISYVPHKKDDVLPLPPLGDEMKTLMAPGGFVVTRGRDGITGAKRWGRLKDHVAIMADILHTHAHSWETLWQAINEQPPAPGSRSVLHVHPEQCPAHAAQDEAPVPPNQFFNTPETREDN